VIFGFFFSIKQGEDIIVQAEFQGRRSISKRVCYLLFYVSLPVYMSINCKIKREFFEK
jgi:hypothetical protein